MSELQKLGLRRAAALMRASFEVPATELVERYRMEQEHQTLIAAWASFQHGAESLHSAHVIEYYWHEVRNRQTWR